MSKLSIEFESYVFKNSYSICQSTFINVGYNQKKKKKKSELVIFIFFRFHLSRNSFLLYLIKVSISDRLTIIKAGSSLQIV